MEWQLSIDEQKQILQRYISCSSGRTRQLLDVLYDEFPEPISEAQLMKRIGVRKRGTFYAQLRNGNSAVGIKLKKCKRRGRSFVLDGYFLRDIAMHRWVHKTMSQSLKH
ncbi:hypothetical protein GT360_13535 [Vibrio astriarenae]|uniref:Uncharacterized protein n=1 Tax=Vibrio astriarenae TaxID=1481923 RepID=A0A7Z2T4V2_9VIBR|nr:hypothetical protein [Vibrio astriarenae]QIA64449.1 hypothetical protein GT360_13535 [Vibrio astriarenae]